MIGIIKIFILMIVSVNYWFGFVIYMKIILLMYCNDKSKNIIIKLLLYMYIGRNFICKCFDFLIYKKYGEFGMWSIMLFEEGF